MTEADVEDNRKTAAEGARSHNRSHNGSHNGPTNGRTGSRFVFFLPLILVTLVTFLVYLPSLENGFVGWDDNVYVYENPDIRAPLPEALSAAFTSFYVGNWHPLTMVSYMLDYALWGMEPFGFHLTSVLLHLLNTLLVFILSLRLVGGLRGLGHDLGPSAAGPVPVAPVLVATVTALLFGIHPLHVESVAWVSERKDVLCAFFFLLSLLAYVEYARVRVKRRAYYAAALVSFALALMSKPMAVTLPIVLLILDYYPLGRLKDAKKVLIEKVPFFALSVVSSAITIWAQHSQGAIGAIEHNPLSLRVLVAVRAYAFYLYKMVVPTELAPLYPLPVSFDFLSLEYAGAFCLLTGVTVFCVYSFKKSPLFAVVWVYYLVTLLPVIGIVQVGAQAAADRYTYLPSLGPFLLLALGAGALYNARPLAWQRTVLLALCSLTIGLLSQKTVLQTRIWADDVTLWTYELRLYPESAYKAHYNLANIYLEREDFDKAVDGFERTLGIKPDHIKARVNLGIAYFSQGGAFGAGSAIAELETAISLDPDNAHAYFNLALIYEKLKRSEKAEELYLRALAIEPAHIGAGLSLGNLYRVRGMPERAIEQYQEVLKHNPGEISARYNMASVYLALGRVDDAASEYRSVLKLSPGYIDARVNLGTAYARGGLFDEAIREYREVLLLDPGLTDARVNLAVAYQKKGLFAEARREFEEVLRQRPGDEKALVALRSLSR